jgi:hypothetical protein
MFEFLASLLPHYSLHTWGLIVATCAGAWGIGYILAWIMDEFR